MFYLYEEKNLKFQVLIYVKMLLYINTCITYISLNTYTLYTYTRRKLFLHFSYQLLSLMTQLSQNEVYIREEIR